MTTETLGSPGSSAGATEAEVLDLDVRVVGVGGGPPFKVVVEFETQGTSHIIENFAAPVTPETVATFAATLSAAQTRHLRVPSAQDRSVDVGAEEIGRLLFDSVFTGESLEVLAQAREVARLQRALLRIRLKLDDAPQIARLPWELMLDGSHYLAQTADQFVVRYTDTIEPPTTAPRDGPLRVLVVAASPADLAELDVDREYAALVEALAPAGDRVVVELLDKPTVVGLKDALTRDWHVVHFIGHGDELESGGVIALLDADGNHDIVDAAHLAEMLDLPQVRLVVLNGCSTGAVPRHQPQNGVAHQLVAQGVPAAVANQFPITDRNAIVFAGALYERLAAGSLVDEAVVHARMRLLHTPEWVTPVLYARTGARLFELPTPDAPPEPAPFHVRDRVPLGTVPDGEQFQERAWVVDEVSAWLESSSPVLLLTGGMGTGKTVLAGWLAGVGPAPQDAAVAATLEAVRSRWDAVRVGTSNLAGGVLDPRALVRSLADQLAASVPGFAPVDTTADLTFMPVEELVALQLEQPLRAARRTGDDPLLLMIDGIDDSGTGGRTTARDLVARLATIDGAPVRLLVTGPDDASLLGPFLGLPDVRRIDLSAPARRDQVDADIAAFVQRRLAGAGVDPGVLAHVTTASEGNFLYADHAADALLASPGTTVADLDLPSGLDESYERWVDQVLARLADAGTDVRWDDAIEPVLAQLAVARGPVPFEALLAWLGWTGPRLSSLLDGLQQLVVPEQQGYGLTHPSLGAMLVRRRFTTGRANSLAVDVVGAHRRVVEHAAAATDADLAAADATGVTYGLVHAPGHLAELVRLGAADDALVDAFVTRASSPEWAEALASHVADPVLLGIPYRDLVGLLLARGQTGRVESLVGQLARTPTPVLRGVVFDVLAAYVARDEAAAEGFMVRMVLDGPRELTAIALHATCLLSPRSQASAFGRILGSGADDTPDDLASAAAFALYANGSADAQGLIRVVLGQMLENLTVLAPRRTAAVITFFGRVTVTNYVNACHDPEVAELTSALWRELLVRRLRINLVNRGLLERLLVKPLMVHQLSERIARLFVSDDGAAPWPTGSDFPGAAEARRVIEVLDPAVPVDPVADDLGVLLRSDVTLLRILATLAVSVHAVAHPDDAGPLLDRLMDTADDRGRRWLLAGHAVVLPETSDTWIPMLESATSTVLTAPHADDADGPLADLHLTFVPLALAYAKAGAPMTLLAEVLATTVGQPDDGRRACCLAGLGATGFSHPDAALAALGTFVDDDLVTLDEAVPALTLLAGVHPLRTRAWLLERGGRGVLDTVWGRLDADASSRYLEFLGMYNNAVHQAVHYPQMRTRLCMTVFRYFLDSRSRREWSARYTTESLAMLREAHYELIRWTE